MTTGYSGRHRAQSSWHQKSSERAATLIAFFEGEPGMNLSPAFQPLLGPLDEAAKRIMVRLLNPDMPAGAVQVDDFFIPFLGNLPQIEKGILLKNARNLKRMIMFQSRLFPLGTPSSCLDLALHGRDGLGGILDSVQKRFAGPRAEAQWKVIERVNNLRNTCIAHAEKDLTDPKQAKEELKHWIGTLKAMHCN